MGVRDARRYAYVVTHIDVSTAPRITQKTAAGSFGLLTNSWVGPNTFTAA